MSDIFSIFTQKYVESNINYEIERKYLELGLKKPKILTFDNITACKLAYKIILIHLFNYSRNLTDEHIRYPGTFVLSKEYSRINNIVRIIERHSKESKEAYYVEEVKKQFLKDLKPPYIDSDSWNYASEETKTQKREMEWNRIVTSKAKIFEMNYKEHTNNILSNGIIFGIFLREYCILCKTPEIKFDELGRLSSTEDYAIKFNNNEGIYFVQGVQFNTNLYKKIFLKKDISGKEVINIRNVEQRAVAIQYVGYDKLIKDLNARLIDAMDEFNNHDNMPTTNELWEFEMEINGRSPRKFRFVKVEDWSTRKKVTLGVPIIQQTETVLGAIAWTFGMTAEEYRPEVQT